MIPQVWKFFNIFRLVNLLSRSWFSGFSSFNLLICSSNLWLRFLQWEFSSSFLISSCWVSPWDLHSLVLTFDCITLYLLTSWFVQVVFDYDLLGEIFPHFFSNNSSTFSNNSSPNIFLRSFYFSSSFINLSSNCFSCNTYSCASTSPDIPLQNIVFDSSGKSLFELLRSLHFWHPFHNMDISSQW